MRLLFNDTPGRRVLPNQTVAIIRILYLLISLSIDCDRRVEALILVSALSVIETCIKGLGERSLCRGVAALISRIEGP